MGYCSETTEELRYIEGMGKFRGKEHWRPGETFPERHLRLVQSYVGNMWRRDDWEGMDRDVIMHFAVEHLREITEEGK